MKKSLLAVAVAAALPAFAQAQSNVTLYGIADVGVSWKDSGGTGAAGGTPGGTMAIDSGIQSTSRWGIRGEEDLGGGLKAIFNYEGGFKTDTGQSDAMQTLTPTSTTNPGGLFQRRAVAGVTGTFGQFLLGRDYTPGFSALGTWDILGYGMWGNALNFSVANVGNFTGSPVRWSNSLQWISPNWSGFTLRGMYTAGENQTDSKSRGNGYGLSGVYAAGPLTIAAFYESQKAPGARSAPIADGATVPKANSYGIGGQYNFGQFRIGGGYAIQDPDTSLKLQYWNIGGGMKLGPGEAMLQYSQMKESLSDAKSDTWAIAYAYPVSRRTNLYVTLAQALNNDKSNYALLASDVAIGGGGLGKDPLGFSVGMRHQF